MPDIRSLNDLTAAAGTSQDPLGMDAVRAVARQIANTVRDEKMAPSITMKVARAVAERKLNASELTEVLDSISTIYARSGRAGFKVAPGAYFVSCMRRAFQRNEIPW
jgi:hypothetical protein